MNYDTIYYWKVRASGSGGYSGWSAISTFIFRSTPSIESLPSLEFWISVTAVTLELHSPEVGSKGVLLIPVLQWGGLAGVG
ncbi:hypothetical protein ACFLXP_03090 [Chloroflexota bacterium]